jgi:hypothetical protein
VGETVFAIAVCHYICRTLPAGAALPIAMLKPALLKHGNERVQHHAQAAGWSAAK